MAHVHTSDQSRSRPNHHSARPSMVPVFEGELGGHVFLTNNEQITENFSRHLFGLPTYYLPTVLRIKEGLPLFLYNFETRQLHGVLEAASDGGLNIEADAWPNGEVTQKTRQPFSKFPAQVRFRVQAEKGKLPESKFRDCVTYHRDSHNERKIYLPLTVEQANRLLELFNMESSHANGPSTPKEQPSRTGDASTGDDTDDGDWEQVKTKNHTKPLKVHSSNSYSRQIGSPTGPSTPRSRSEVVGNGDISAGKNGERWRQESNDWVSRPGVKQPAWTAKEGVPEKEEKALPAVRKHENGVLDPLHIARNGQKKGVLSRPEEEQSDEVPASSTDAPVRKSSTFSYSAALKVGLPSKIEPESVSEPVTPRQPEAKVLEPSGNGAAFPSLSKSNSGNERRQKAPKKSKDDSQAKPEENGDKEGPAEAPAEGRSKAEVSKPVLEPVAEQKPTRQPPSEMSEPVKPAEKAEAWGKLPAPPVAISLAEPQKKETAEEQQAADPESTSTSKKEEPSATKVGGEAPVVDREKPKAIVEGGERRAGPYEGAERKESAKMPVGRGWEHQKRPEGHRVVQVQAPLPGGVPHKPAPRQRTPPKVLLSPPYRRVEPPHLNDLSALPPSAPERIQQRTMGGGPPRNRTPPLNHHRPHPVQVPPPEQLPAAAMRISPTAMPYTPSSGMYTPTANMFTPTGRISPGLRPFLSPMGGAILVQQQSDGTLTYVPHDHWQRHHHSGGRSPGPPRTNEQPPQMMYSPKEYGYALSAASPPSAPAISLGVPALPMFVGGAQLPPPPAELLANADLLHHEILAYAQRVRRRPEARARAVSAVLCVRRAIQSVWPGADVEIFGSFSTGLCLPHSDVDLAVVGAPAPPPELANVSGGRPLVPLIRELAAALEPSPWLDSLTTIETASMPVIKLRCKPDAANGGGEVIVERSSEGSPESSVVAIDITIMGRRGQPMGKDKKQEGPPPKSQHNGVAARQFVIERLRKVPGLAPLVLLLKSYLHHRGLNDVYTGGLGSFSLTLLLVFYLERVTINPYNGQSPSPGPSLPGPVSSARDEVSRSSAAKPAAEEAASSASERDPPSETDAESSPSDSESKQPEKSGKDDAIDPAGGSPKDDVPGMTEPADWLAAGPMPNLGSLLIGFLHLFGNELDLSTVRLVMKNENHNGGIFFHDKLTRPVALWIDDPLRPGANIGAGSFAMYNVQAALRDMLRFLSPARDTPPHQENHVSPRGQAPSLVEQLFTQVYPERSTTGM